MTKQAVAVLGAGNGGCAAAADLANRGVEVRLFSRSPARLAPLIDRGGIEMSGALGEAFVELPIITTDLEAAVSEAQVIMLVVPISALPFFAAALADIVLPDQVVFLNPGHMGGGLYLSHEIHRRTGRTDVRTCEVSTLTYGCRFNAPASVNINHVVTSLSFASFPGKHRNELYEIIRSLYPEIVPVKDVLETGFLDINAVEHPPQAICNAGWIEHTKGDYLFYYEGTTASVGRVIDALDRERVSIAAAAGISTKPFLRIFFENGYTTEGAVEIGTAHAALRESAPNRWIKGPQSLDHRYLHEDVGWGLVPWAEFGRDVGVATPVMDGLITLASALNATDYRTNGLTLEKLGLKGKTSDQLAAYLVEGIPRAAGDTNDQP